MAPKDQFRTYIAELGLPPDVFHSLETIYMPIGHWLNDKRQTHQGLLTLGIAGAQGSGKSTFCKLLAQWLGTRHNLNIAILSIDDLYLTRSERQALSKTIHPLCAIRGVPGTHDLTLGHQTLDALSQATPTERVRLPRFDKTLDDRCEAAEWESIFGQPDILLFEGWCVGASPLEPWAGPINKREANEDPDGTWARWSIQALADDYQHFFNRIDATVMLRVPSMDVVRSGRWKQEQRAWSQVKASKLSANAPGLMTQEEVHAYVDLFERLTTSMMTKMPKRVDVLIEQDASFSQTLVHMPKVGFTTE